MRRLEPSTIAAPTILGVALAVAGLGARGAAPSPGARPPAPAQAPAGVLDTIRAACGAVNPYFAVTNFAHADDSPSPPGEPAVIAFRDTATDVPGAHLVLATQAQVGAVYGLAYDAARGHLYTAAYHKRGTAFGPGGPGQVYDIDLAGGQVRPLASLYAGPDRHAYRTDMDLPAAEWVGWAGLADIDLSDDGRTLFVVNLTHGVIHRLAVPEGRDLGTIRHGAADAQWARNARPFGLAFHDGYLYHGVVNTMKFSDLPGSLSGYVYRSRPDGSEMTELTRFDLGYARPTRWQPWSDVAVRGSLSGYYQPGAQAILADIVATGPDELVIGIRDRYVDTLPALGRFATVFNPNQPQLFPGAGDVLPLRRAGDRWGVITSPEHYDDLRFWDESTFGALARVPGFDMLVATSRGPRTSDVVGAQANWVAGGGIAWVEPLKAIVQSSQTAGLSNGLGDVEGLCPADTTPDPDLLPTATAIAVTATAAARATVTARALIPPPPGQPTPEHFDREIALACETDNPFVATVCYAPAGLHQFGLDAPTVITFRDTPADTPHYTLASTNGVGAVWGLAYSAREGALYGSAFHKRMAYFGRGGPGAIYRMEVATGAITVFTTVPDAGPDTHGTVATGDDPAADWAGKLSLGDIDLDTDGRDLYVVNLGDRRIYRYDVATAALLDRFAHGAAAEPWAADARPFALKFFRGRLFHGVVHSAETSQDRGDLAGYVYSSLPGGSDMRLETRFGLDHPRGIARIPGVVQNPGLQDVPLDWLPWKDGYNSVAGGRTQAAVYPQPLVSDIEFFEDGDMSVAIRDRYSDMSLTVQIQTGGQIFKPALGVGEVLSVPFDGRGWPGPARPDHFANPAGSAADRSAVGGLGQIVAFDRLVANRLHLSLNNPFGSFLSLLEGMIWYDGDGNQLRLEQACAEEYFFPIVPTPTAATPPPGPSPVPSAGPSPTPAPWSDAPRPGPAGDALDHSEWVPGKGMGDVEVLCGPSPTPTATTEAPTDTPSPTPSPTPTRTATPSPTATATPSPTATPVPRPIYLPIVIGDRCDPKVQPVDVVLVIDASTSMLFPTRAGRPKIDAAKEAARRFLDQMKFPGDQAAIVAFNAGASVVVDLTGDKQALVGGLGGIRNQEFTRIHLGLAAAHGLLTGARRVANHTPVVVMLTDGRSNPDPVSRALDAATALKADGITLYTVGLGEDVEFEALRRMATRTENFHWAPDGEDLGPIYEEIAREVPCPRRAYWPYRP